MDGRDPTASQLASLTVVDPPHGGVTVKARAMVFTCIVGAAYNFTLAFSGSFSPAEVCMPSAWSGSVKEYMFVLLLIEDTRRTTYVLVTVVLLFIRVGGFVGVGCTRSLVGFSRRGAFRLLSSVHCVVFCVSSPLAGFGVSVFFSATRCR